MHSCCVAVLLNTKLRSDTISASDIAGTIIDVPVQLVNDSAVASKRFSRVSSQREPGSLAHTSPTAPRLHYRSCTVFHLDASVQLLGQCRGCSKWERDTLRHAQRRDEDRFADPIPLVLPGHSEATFLPSNVASVFTPTSALTKVCYN